MFLDHTFKSLNRIRDIIKILLKYGFEDLIANSTIRKYIPEKVRIKRLRGSKPVYEYSRWERIRLVIEELGPTFIKFGQVLSNRPDMLPLQLIVELEKLQDNVPSFESATAKVIIEQETGFAIHDLFEEFIEQPIASASIGQVHKARLKNGKWVVVKVQRPNLKEIIDLDLSILKDMVKRADRYLKKQGILNAHEIVLLFERTMLKELDYRNEARNIEKFKKHYSHFTTLYIPEVHKKYSGERVLFLEYIEACKITNKKQLIEWGLNPYKVVETGMHLYLTQIFEIGFFHADPHPGNVLVRKDGVICLLDFGMIGQLMRKDRIAFANVFISIAKEDAREMALNMRRLAIEDNVEDMKAFQYDLNQLIEDYASLEIHESSIAEMTTALQKIMYDYEIKTPPAIFLIFRAFAILEGIGKQLHPHFKFYEFVKPYGKRIIEEQYQIKNILLDLSYRANQISTLVNTFPTDIKSIIDKIKSGRLHVQVDHQGYGYLLKKLDSITNRLSLTFIIVALIIGSSISMTVDFPPEYVSIEGIPYVSLVGLWASGFLGIILFYSIIRRQIYK